MNPLAPDLDAALAAHERQQPGRVYVHLTDETPTRIALVTAGVLPPEPNPRLTPEQRRERERDKKRRQYVRERLAAEAAGMTHNAWRKARQAQRQAQEPLAGVAGGRSTWAALPPMAGGKEGRK